jgi:hypothetical protein
MMTTLRKSANRLCILLNHYEQVNLALNPPSNDIYHYWMRIKYDELILLFSD